MLSGNGFIIALLEYNVMYTQCEQVSDQSYFLLLSEGDAVGNSRKNLFNVSFIVVVCV